MTALDTKAGRGAAADVDARAYRLSDIDMVRGLVIAIMAIDHTREFRARRHRAGIRRQIRTSPPRSSSRAGSRTSARPVFVFLAGTSAA
jgi:uncharacterized membrane protein